MPGRNETAALSRERDTKGNRIRSHVDYEQNTVSYGRVKLGMPEGFRELLESLTRGVIRKQPENIPLFLEQYFQNLLESQRNEREAEKRSKADRARTEVLESQRAKKVKFESEEKARLAQETENLRHASQREASEKLSAQERELELARAEVELKASQALERIEREHREAQRVRDEMVRIKAEKAAEEARLKQEKDAQEEEARKGREWKAMKQAEKARIEEAIETERVNISNQAAVLRDLQKAKEITEANVEELANLTEKLNLRKEDLNTTVNELADSVQKLQEEKEILEVTKRISSEDAIEEISENRSETDVPETQAPEKLETEPIVEERVEPVPELEQETEPVMVIPKVPGGEVKAVAPGKVSIPHIKAESSLDQIFWDNVYKKIEEKISCEIVQQSLTDLNDEENPEELELMPSDLSVNNQ